MRQSDCEEKRDPDLAKSRIKDENMELDPKARLEKQTLAERLKSPLSGPCGLAYFPMLARSA